MSKIKSFGMKAYFATASVVGMLAFPTSVFAQPSWWPTVGPDFDSLDELIQIGLNTAIIAAAVVAVAFLIMGGYKYMTASGDAGKTEEAQKAIANALIGLVICLAAAIIVNFVLQMLRVEPQPIDQ